MVSFRIREDSVVSREDLGLCLSLGLGSEQVSVFVVYREVHGGESKLFSEVYILRPL